MTDRKLIKGNYYSCQHQKLGKENCNTCSSVRGGMIDTELKDLKCSECKKSRGNIYIMKGNGTNETRYQVY